jgi:hypothetical protein
VTGERADTRIPPGLTREMTYILPASVGDLFADTHDVLARPLPWNQLPSIYDAVDEATEHAATIVDPAFMEWQASLRQYDEPDDELGHDGIAPLFIHESETAALLHVALASASPLIRTMMDAHAITHDAGKTHPQLNWEYHDGTKWTQQKVDRLSQRHQHLSEVALRPLIAHEGAHFALEPTAVLNGIHHYRNLSAIKDLRLRWMCGLFQEADGAQSLLLDARKYTRDGTTREGISLDNVDALYNKLVKPFQAPFYFGIGPGRIFNIALAWREQRRAEMQQA